MDFDSIMRRITSGLTGEAEHDLPYLKEQGELYKDHEMAQEILRACGRLIYKLLPEDALNSIEKAINNDLSGLNESLEEARFNVYKKNYSTALKIMEGIVEKLEAVPMFKDDQVSEYHTFDEPFENNLYYFLFNPDKEVRQASFPYAQIYFEYGGLLVELKRIEDAQQALLKAHHWNPCRADILFEFAETFKVSKQFEEFFRQTKHAFKVSFRPKDVARCYRNLAFYFVEKELFKEAVAFNFLSLRFEPDSKSALSEMYYIGQISDVDITHPDWSEVEALCKKYEVPLMADDDVVGLSYSLGKHYFEEQQYDAARYYLTIANDLTGFETVKAMLQEIPEQEG